MREYKYEWDVLYVKCNVCWKFKTISEYDKGSKYRFWVRTYCKDCMRDYSQRRYSNKRDYIANQNKEYYWNNKLKTSEHKKEYYKENKERIKKHANDLNGMLWFNRHTFHIRALDYVKKYKLNPWICSICWVQWRTEMHHPSYKSFNEWKNVVFCCKSCHFKIHSGNIDCPEPVDLTKLKN